MESARRPRYQVTFVTLVIGIGAFALLQSMVIPVLSTVQAELHTSQSAVTWVLTAYLLSASVMTPILGRVGDIYGKKWVFVATLVALVLGSVLAAVAPNLAVMIVARAIQGLAGGMLPVGFGIIRDEFPADKVAGTVGVLAALLAVGGSLGIVLAGPIVNALSWRWLFWLPAIVTVIATVGAVLFVPQSPIRSPGTISWLPAILLSGWLVLLLVPLSEASDWGWGSPAVLGMLAGAVLLAAAWAWSELRAATPLIDMKMMRLPAVWTNNAVALLIGVGLYAMFAFLPEFVQTPSAAGYGFGASITRSGLMLLPSGVTMFAAGLFAGSLTRRYGGKVLVVVGLPHRLRGDGDVRLRALTAVGDLRRHRHPRRRLRTGLLGDVGQCRVRGAGRADRRRHRHERQHPDDRRQHRRRRDGQHRHRQAGAFRPARGVRLHDRVRRHGRRPAGGRAGRRADPVAAEAGQGGHREGGCRYAGHVRGRTDRGKLPPARRWRASAAIEGGPVDGESLTSDPAGPHLPGRRDAVRNYHRVLDAAREVLGESGADASMEEIAARAGVGVGTVYRRFANKDALIDELVRLSLAAGA